MKSALGLVLIPFFYITQVFCQACPQGTNVARMCEPGTYSGERVLIDTTYYDPAIINCSCIFGTTSSLVKLVTYVAPNYPECKSAIRIYSSAGNTIRFQCLMSGTYLDTSVHSTGVVTVETYSGAYDTNYCLVLERAGRAGDITVTCTADIPPIPTTTLPDTTSKTKNNTLTENNNTGDIVLTNYNNTVAEQNTSRKELPTTASSHTDITTTGEYAPPSFTDTTSTSSQIVLSETLMTTHIPHKQHITQINVATVEKINTYNDTISAIISHGAYTLDPIINDIADTRAEIVTENKTDASTWDYVTLNKTDASTGEQVTAIVTGTVLFNGGNSNSVKTIQTIGAVPSAILIVDKHMKEATTTTQQIQSTSDHVLFGSELKAAISEVPSSANISSRIILPLDISNSLIMKIDPTATKTKIRNTTSNITNTRNINYSIDFPSVYEQDVSPSRSNTESTIQTKSVAMNNTNETHTALKVDTSNKSNVTMPSDHSTAIVNDTTIIPVETSEDFGAMRNDFIEPIEVTKITSGKRKTSPFTTNEARIVMESTEHIDMVANITDLDLERSIVTDRSMDYLPSTTLPSTTMVQSYAETNTTFAITRTDENEFQNGTASQTSLSKSDVADKISGFNPKIVNLATPKQFQDATGGQVAPRVEKLELLIGEQSTIPTTLTTSDLLNKEALILDPIVQSTSIPATLGNLNSVHIDVLVVDSTMQSTGKPTTIPPLDFARKEVLVVDSTSQSTNILTTPHPLVIVPQDVLVVDPKIQSASIPTTLTSLDIANNNSVLIDSTLQSLNMPTAPGPLDIVNNDVLIVDLTTQSPHIPTTPSPLDIVHNVLIVDPTMQTTNISTTLDSVHNDVLIVDPTMQSPNIPTTLGLLDIVHNDVLIIDPTMQSPNIPTQPSLLDIVHTDILVVDPTMQTSNIPITPSLSNIVNNDVLIIDPTTQSARIPTTINPFVILAVDTTVHSANIPTTKSALDIIHKQPSTHTIQLSNNMTSFTISVVASDTNDATTTSLDTAMGFGFDKHNKFDAHNMEMFNEALPAFGGRNIERLLEEHGNSIPLSDVRTTAAIPDISGGNMEQVEPVSNVVRDNISLPGVVNITDATPVVSGGLDDHLQNVNRGYIPLSEVFFAEATLEIARGNVDHAQLANRDSMRLPEESPKTGRTILETTSGNMSHGMVLTEDINPRITIAEKTNFSSKIKLNNEFNTGTENVIIQQQLQSITEESSSTTTPGIRTAHAATASDIQSSIEQSFPAIVPAVVAVEISFQQNMLHEAALHASSDHTNSSANNSVPLNILTDIEKQKLTAIETTDTASSELNVNASDKNTEKSTDMIANGVHKSSTEVQAGNGHRTTFGVDGASERISNENSIPHGPIHIGSIDNRKNVHTTLGQSINNIDKTVVASEVADPTHIVAGSGTTSDGGNDMKVYFDSSNSNSSGLGMTNDAYIIVVGAIVGLVVLAVVVGIFCHNGKKRRSEKVNISGSNVDPATHQNQVFDSEAGEFEQTTSGLEKGTDQHRWPDENGDAAANSAAQEYNGNVEL